jgi:hypothetical protein
MDFVFSVSPDQLSGQVGWPAAKAYKVYKYLSNITPRMASRRMQYRSGLSVGTGLLCQSLTHGRLLKHPILLLAVLREILIANFKMVPRTARQTADFDFVVL